MLNFINKKLTKKYTEIPLLWIYFNLNKFLEEGKENSCILKIHPELKWDDYIINTLNNLVDYIRDNYDMEKLSK